MSHMRHGSVAHVMLHNQHGSIAYATWPCCTCNIANCMSQATWHVAEATGRHNEDAPAMSNMRLVMPQEGLLTRVTHKSRRTVQGAERVIFVSCSSSYGLNRLKPFVPHHFGMDLSTGGTVGNSAESCIIRLPGISEWLSKQKIVMGCISSWRGSCAVVAGTHRAERTYHGASWGLRGTSS